MPFTKQEDRKKIDNMTNNEIIDMLFKEVNDLTNVSVGDKCYYFYKKMVEKFTKERRWTTAHYIYQDMKKEIQNSYDISGSGIGWAEDTRIAYELAWQVFFINYVMTYEYEKEIENGTI